MKINGNIGSMSVLCIYLIINVYDLVSLVCYCGATRSYSLDYFGLCFVLTCWQILPHCHLTERRSWGSLYDVCIGFL